MITAVNGRLAEGSHGPGLRPFRKEHALPITPKDPSLVQPSQEFPAVGIDPIPGEPARRRPILHIDRLHITIEVCHGLSVFVPEFICHRSASAAMGLSWVVFGIGFPAGRATAPANSDPIVLLRFLIWIPATAGRDPNVSAFPHASDAGISPSLHRGACTARTNRGQPSHENATRCSAARVGPIVMNRLPTNNRPGDGVRNTLPHRGNTRTSTKCRRRDRARIREDALHSGRPAPAHCGWRL